VGLGHRGLEFREKVGGHLRTFDGFRDAVEEPGPRRLRSDWTRYALPFTGWRACRCQS